MINVSNAFKQELYEGHRNYLEYADITLSDGTELNLTNKDFWQGGMSLDDAVSGNDIFEIGAAIVNSCSLTIENLDDRFSEYDFLNAKVVTYVGLNLPDGTTEKIRKGTYTVNDPKYNGATISLKCQDNMAKFDRPYSESKLVYPANLGVIIRDACSICDASLQTYDFPHSDFVIQTRPTDETITFREIISWAAQIAGCFCRCDVQGRLELKWYNQQLLEKHGYDGGIFDKVSSTRYTTGDNVDGGTFNPWTDGDSADGGTFEELEGIHHIYSHYSAPVISTDDVVITGVRVLEKAKEQDEETGSEKDAIITYQSGSDGYVVSIENNELIQGGTGREISNWLGQQLIGFRFRKASLSHASDPTIEAGDIAIITDRKQNTYPIIISSTRFSTGSAQSTESSAETPARNSAARFSAQTKNYVEYRKDIEKERTEREKAQEELKERIDSSSGLYTTEETQSDGSKVFYMHDKPTLKESKIVWKMTAEAWGVSTDGGDTYNAGITVDGDVIARILTATGINADWIKTGAFRIEKDGKVIFLADAETKQVKIVADEFSLSSGETIGSIAKSAVNDFISETYDPKIAELQKQLDGQIESFYYDYTPTLDNAPASNWETETDKQKHEGDLFYDRTTGYAYRFYKEDGTWKWQMIQDTDITKAIQDAANAQYTADGKRRTFLTTPQPPYDEGDLWYGGTNADVMVCTNSRESGSYSSADWSKRDKYIDQSAADTAATNAVNAQTQADIFNKLTNNQQIKGIFMRDGELYVNATYINSGTLTVSKDGAETFYANMGTGEVRIKAKSFALESGDTIESIAEDKATAAQNNAKSYTDSKASDTLSDAKDYADSTATNKANTAVNNAMTQQNIFNKLTGGGENQGIYLQDGKVYINAEYIQSGTLSADFIKGGILTLGGYNNSNGYIEVLNESNAGKVSINSQGITVKSGGYVNIDGGEIRNCTMIECSTSPVFRGLYIGGNSSNYKGRLEAYEMQIFAPSGTTHNLMPQIPLNRVALLTKNAVVIGRDFGTYGEANILCYNNKVYIAPELIVDNNLEIGGRLNFQSSAKIYSPHAQLLHFYASDETNYGLQYGVVDNTWALAPYISAKLKLGTASHEWNAIYAHNSTVQSSDARKKNSIMPISTVYEQVFEQLRPVSYRFNSGDRVHTGFISQDVEETLNDVGLTAEDWGAFCKDTGEDGEDIYGMRYSEVIALNTHMIQKLMKRIDELEARIQELEGR